jgi:hypothetical protein
MAGICEINRAGRLAGRGMRRLAQTAPVATLLAAATVRLRMPVAPAILRIGFALRT